MVVGGIAGHERFLKRNDLKSALEYSTLERIVDDKTLQNKINQVLREAGVRYSSTNLDKCNKSRALVHNLKFIRNYKKGFEGILDDLSSIDGSNAEIDRANQLMRHFRYVKNKSARDFLMNMGINRNTLALDIRVQNIFKQLGIAFPKSLSSKSIYNETEREIIEKICIPLKIEPLLFDRILFQNYDSIMAGKRFNIAIY
jgi:thermostable 8-oxoguanine DNA glycosylase